MFKATTKLARPSLFNAVRKLPLSDSRKELVEKTQSYRADQALKPAPELREDTATRASNKVVNFFQSVQETARDILNPELETVIKEMYKHPIPRLSVSDSWEDIAMIRGREDWLRKQVSKGQAPIDAWREMYRRQPPVADWERLIDEMVGVVQGNSPKL